MGETMKPKHAVTKSRIGEETPMPKSKAMSPVVPRAVGGTEMPQPEPKDDGDDGDDDEDKNDYAETMVPKHAVTKSRIGEETSMPKSKDMSPVVPRAVGGTGMPQPEPKDDGDDGDDEDKNDYAETMVPKKGVTKSRIGEETPMPKAKGMSPVVPRAVGGTEMPQPEPKDDGDDDDDDEDESKKSKKATLL